MDDFVAGFLARLWDEQRKADISSAELARRIGCDHAVLSRWKTGARKPRVTLEFAHRAALAFPALRVGFGFPTGTEDVTTITDAEEGR